jgi:hypothetical protein
MPLHAIQATIASRSDPLAAQIGQPGSSYHYKGAARNLPGVLALPSFDFAGANTISLSSNLTTKAVCRDMASSCTWANFAKDLQGKHNQGPDYKPKLTSDSLGPFGCLRTYACSYLRESITDSLCHTTGCGFLSIHLAKHLLAHKYVVKTINQELYAYLQRPSVQAQGLGTAIGKYATHQLPGDCCCCQLAAEILVTTIVLLEPSVTDTGICKNPGCCSTLLLRPSQPPLPLTPVVSVIITQQVSYQPLQPLSSKMSTAWHTHSSSVVSGKSLATGPCSGGGAKASQHYKLGE